MATPILTEKEIRIFLMDKPELNTLVDGIKFSPEDIEQAQLYVVDYFNMLPPPTGNSYSLETFPFRALMLIGVAGHLLKGASIGDTMNQFDYSVDGVQISDRSHGQAYMQLGLQFWEEFKDLAKNIKISRNIERVFGVLNSEYNARAFL